MNPPLELYFSLPDDCSVPKAEISAIMEAAKQIEANFKATIRALGWKLPHDANFIVGIEKIDEVIYAFALFSSLIEDHNFFI